MLIKKYHLVNQSNLGKQAFTVEPYFSFENEIDDQIKDLCQLFEYPSIPRLPIYYADALGVLNEWLYEEDYPGENTYLYNQWKTVYLPKLYAMDSAALSAKGVIIDLPTVRETIHKIVLASNTMDQGIYVEGFNPFTV